MTSPWQMLAGNLAVAALFILGWGHARYWLRNLPGTTRSILFGITMGLGVVCTTLMSVQIQPGFYLDLRLVLVAISSFLGGPIAGVITTVMAIAYRTGMDLNGAALSAINLLAMMSFSLIGYALVSKRSSALTHALCIGSLVGIIATWSALAASSLPLAVSVRELGIPVSVVNFFGAFLACLVLIQARRLAEDRDLLVSAIHQAPDLAYVKDNLGRFAAVNNAAAKHFGFAHPKDMLGKSDFDVMSTERAQRSLDIEREVLDTGEPLIDFEEQLIDEHGAVQWFSTDKIPLLGAHGELVGITAVTRDITAEKLLRQDLIDSRNTLSYALDEMSDGLAMFDGDGRLEFCNDQYRNAFPLSGPYRNPGASMRDILRAVIDTNEQSGPIEEDADEWIERISANLRQDSEEDVNLFDGRWLQVRTRPTARGKTLVVVSDVTRIKQAEQALHSATDQLKHLVRTDALTGLANRRAFDETIEIEVARSLRSGTPLSLIMIDVDHFKAYNDHYGHPAGDECLRLVGEHLSKSLKRPADLVARYGGEEFVAILPDTDEDGAYQVAESFRKALAAARIPHRGTDRHYVTASAGVATYMPDNQERSAAEITRHADDALYSAKAAGRDRVFGTRISGHSRRRAGR